MQDKRYFVYIMSNRSRTIYTGMTNSLRRRVAEHKGGLTEGFAKRYNVDVRDAIHREKEIKGLDRARRVALIEAENATWEELAADWHKTHMYGLDPAVKQQIPRGLTPTCDDN